MKKAQRLLVHLVLALPLLWLAWQWAWFIPNSEMSGAAREIGLTANPVQYTINELGIWTIRLLTFTLAITPMRVILGWRWFAPYRRAAGLWTFAYAGVHLLFYAGLDLYPFSFEALFKDVIKHNFILFGMGAFLIMLPLAVTSTQGWIKRLKAKRWQKLHKWVYVAGVFAVVHFVLRVKGFQYEPWIYAAIIGLLLLCRLSWVQKRLRFG